MAQLAEVSDLTDLAIAAHGGAVSAAAPLVGDAAAHLLACMGSNQDTLRSVIATDSVPFHVAETLLRSFEPLLAAPAGVAAALQPPGGRLPDGAVSLDALVGLLCLLSRGSVTEKLTLVCWTLDRHGGPQRPSPPLDLDADPPTLLFSTAHCICTHHAA